MDLSELQKPSLLNYTHESSKILGLARRRDARRLVDKCVLRRHPTARSVLSLVFGRSSPSNYYVGRVGFASVFASMLLGEPIAKFELLENFQQRPEFAEASSNGVTD